MVRVLHILSSRLATGTAKQIDLLCAALDAQGYDNSLCSVEPDQERRQRLPNFRQQLAFCRLGSKFDFSFLPRLRRLVHRLRPSLIHIWGDDARTLATFSSLVENATPIVVSVRSFGAAATVVPVLDRWLLRRVRCFVVNHPELPSVMAQQAIPLSQIEVIGNAVETPSTGPTLPSIHHELNEPSDVRFVGVCGDLCEKKRIKDLIWAMDLLRVIRPSMRLLIMGTGEALGELRAFSRQVHLEPCVHFLGHRSDVRGILGQCDCLWQASRDEGCSNAVLEAMAARAPVITSDIPGHRQLVQHGVTGFLVPLGDCAEFARKTNVLLESTSLSRTVREAAWQQVETAYTVDRMVNAYQALYTSVLTRPAERVAS